MEDLMDIGEVTESRTFHQLGILVLDGSGSMKAEGDLKTSLAENVNLAVKEFFTFFKGSSIVNNFSIAVVTFDDDAKVHTPPTALTAIDDYGDYNPLNGHGGGTNIGLALEEAEKLANAHINAPEAEGILQDVKIIVMSDGLCQHADNTRKIAERIKQNPKIMICSALFIQRGSSNDPAKSLLLEIASAPNLYKTTYSEQDLRKFFISSMSAKINLQKP
jgi:uncharacterized protein YegL